MCSAFHGMDQMFHGKVLFDMKMLNIWKDIIGSYPVILIVSQNTTNTEATGKIWRPYDYNIFSFRHMEYAYSCIITEGKTNYFLFRITVFTYTNI